MADKELDFKIIEEVNNIKFPIFDVSLTKKAAPNEKEGNYVSIKSPDWVSAVVETERASFGDKFVMVSQYRHGVNMILTEFPCGMVEEGETPLDAILRECEEEIGLDKNKILEIKKLYETNPNPAFMNNKMTCYYIKIESISSEQKLDENEFVKKTLLDEHRVESIINFPETSVMMKYAWEKYKSQRGANGNF